MLSISYLDDKEDVASKWFGSMTDNRLYSVRDVQTDISVTNQDGLTNINLQHRSDLFVKSLLTHSLTDSIFGTNRLSNSIQLLDRDRVWSKRYRL